MPILVLAGNAVQFREYCRTRQLRPGQDVLYLDSRRVLLGKTAGTQVRLTGTWKYQPKDILEHARVIGCVIMEDPL